MPCLGPLPVLLRSAAGARRYAVVPGNDDACAAAVPSLVPSLVPSVPDVDGPPAAKKPRASTERESE